jgi:hypothetical protein
MRAAIVREDGHSYDQWTDQTPLRAHGGIGDFALLDSGLLIAFSLSAERSTVNHHFKDNSLLSTRG